MCITCVELVILPSFPHSTLSFSILHSGSVLFRTSAVHHTRASPVYLDHLFVGFAQLQLGDGLNCKSGRVAANEWRRTSTAAIFVFFSLISCLSSMLSSLLSPVSPDEVIPRIIFLPIRLLIWDIKLQTLRACALKTIISLVAARTYFFREDGTVFSQIIIKPVNSTDAMPSFCYDLCSRIKKISISLSFQQTRTRHFLGSLSTFAVSLVMRATRSG